MMNVSEIKKEFPQFEHNPELVYLDSAATSLTPISVLEALDDYYKHYRANIHRGLYKEAQKASDMYEQAREKVASFIGAHPDEVIFTAGATAAANMLTYALEQSFTFSPSDEIVTTVMDHHASLLPMQGLAKRKNLTLRHITLTGTGLDTASVDACIGPKTKIVCLALASNVLGSINDVKTITKKAHAVGAHVCVDATAAVGHIPVQVRDLDVDALFFSGHKMCGPTGIGVLYGKKAFLEQLAPSFFGGGIVEQVSLDTATWTDVPTRFEAGTPHIAGAIGLAEAVRYVEALDVNAIHEHCMSLVEYMQNALKEIPAVEVFSGDPSSNVGIVSFTHTHIHPHDIADIAGRSGVALRAGHHCALPLHTALGLSATTRASVYLYNSTEDLDALIRALEEVRLIFNS